MNNKRLKEKYRECKRAFEQECKTANGFAAELLEARQHLALVIKTRGVMQTVAEANSNHIDRLLGIMSTMVDQLNNQKAQIADLSKQLEQYRRRDAADKRWHNITTDSDRIRPHTTACERIREHTRANDGK